MIIKINLIKQVKKENLVAIVDTAANFKPTVLH